MDRSFFTSLVASLLGLSSTGVLGLAFSTSDPPPGKPPADWRLLDPVTYQNLTIFPVVAANNYDTSAFLTLDEGLATGEVVVREQGSQGMARNRDGRDGILRPADSNGASVNQLVLINRGKRPLLLLAGELVSGGKQDRIIGKDRLVPVGADPLPSTSSVSNMAAGPPGLPSPMPRPSFIRASANKLPSNAIRARSGAPCAAVPPPKPSGK